MSEKWVFNASPLILLGKAGQLAWLDKLGTVIIPSAVADEIRAGSPDDPARIFVEDPARDEWIRNVPTNEDVLAWDLGSGEAAVIAWAIEHPDHEAVLDDSAARRCGGVFGIRLRGTLSLVALAKKRGWLPACRPVFNKMLEAGLFVSPELVNQVAESVGE